MSAYILGLSEGSGVLFEDEPIKAGPSEPGNTAYGKRLDGMVSLLPESVVSAILGRKIMAGETTRIGEAF